VSAEAIKAQPTLTIEKRDSRRRLALNRIVEAEITLVGYGKGVALKAQSGSSKPLAAEFGRLRRRLKKWSKRCRVEVTEDASQ